MIKFANVEESNFASLLRRSFIFKIQALFVDKPGPQHTPAQCARIAYVSVVSDTLVRRVGAHDCATRDVLYCSSLKEHIVLRSYIEDKFPEGPANGVFPRYPDLREFVVSRSATPVLACADRGPLASASQSRSRMRWHVVPVKWSMSHGIRLFFRDDTPAI